MTFFHALCELFSLLFPRIREKWKLDETAATELEVAKGVCVVGRRGGMRSETLQGEVFGGSGAETESDWVRDVLRGNISGEL